MCLSSPHSFQTSLIFLTLFLLLTISTASVVPSDTPRSFFAIAGLPSHTSARILYYSSQPIAKLSLFQLAVHEGQQQSGAAAENLGQDYRLISQFSWDMTRESPRVQKLDGLQQDTTYKLVFHNVKHMTREFTAVEAPSKIDYSIHFRTLGAEHAYRPSHAPFKLISLSCDRFFDDGDESMWHMIEEKETEYDLMVHLGDQFYADRIWKQRDENTTTVEQFLEEFRNLYHLYYERDVIREVYRRGSHVALPDDHDIINNLNHEYILSALNDTAKRNFIIAGRRAYMEYQYQLTADIPANFPYENLHESVDVWNFDVRVDGLCNYFLDTRYETTFRFDPEYPLLGKRQHEALLEALAKCPAENKIVLYSSIPLAQFDEYCANLVYVAEKEIYASHPKFSFETLQLLDELAPFADRTLLVGGDIHQHLKTRLIRYSRDNITTPSVLHFASSSGVSEDSRVLSEFKLYLFNILVHFWSFGWTGQWRLDHYLHYFAKNYMVIHRGAQHHVYDLPGLSYYGVFYPLSSYKEIVLDFVFNHFVLLEILLICAVGIVAQHFLAHPGDAEEELRKQKVE
eukprot:CAMPEP_0117445428 /NCGR_PEP_ID=MMETSP0759-20121206/5790_1 /TAXON_ID=63605 /ORGANISM="Percolomonas cosmopolitus, Strain WS" /LENGTH=570 /DNA_ID=CAMNT_0005237603 /DNA_START=53 /DNA_END=1765 /DNA_ORIENTATION=-